MDLVVVVMGQDCEKFLPMCLDSVSSADAKYYLDGGSKDKSMEIAEKKGFTVLQHPYDQIDKEMNGKQRNFYLDFLKKSHPNTWCLALDADEVVEDFERLRLQVEQLDAKEGNKMQLISIHMRHFIGDLGHEDSTVEKHFVPNRLFKVSPSLHYPLGEHPVLNAKDETIISAKTEATTIWHLAYVPNMWDYKKRYDNHLKKSEIHTPEYLYDWYYAHLFGLYPNKALNPEEIPPIILRTFGMNPDEIYFKKRNLELKHFIDALHWRDFFKPTSVFEVGCGKGPRVFALRSVGVDASGMEISPYAVGNSFCPKYIRLGDLTKDSIEEHEHLLKTYDLVVAYDVLEHIDPKDFDKAVEYLITKSKKYILVSAPFLGDPNLMNDKTHRIFQKREWWAEQFTSRGLLEVKVPDNFLYKEQLLIFQKNDDNFTINARVIA